MGTRATTTKTPDEEATLADIAAQEAAGGDPFGDNEPLVAETIESTAAKDAARIAAENGEGAAEGEGAEGEAGEAGDAGEAGQGAEAGEDAAGAADPETSEPGTDEAVQLADEDAITEHLKAYEDVPDTPPPPLPSLRYQAGLAELNTKRTELETREADSLKKLMDGEIEAAEHARTISEVRRDLGAIDRTVAKAEMERDAYNEAEAATVRWIAKQGAKQGLFYATDTAAVAQFNAALAAVEVANPKMAYRQMVQEAHATVLALRGISKARDTLKAAETTAAAKAADKTPPARKPGKAPVTLRGLPEAEAQKTGGDLAAQLGRLKGDAYQQAFNKLTPAQKASLVDD